MARIAGVDLPREKRVEIGLTYIFGIGRATSNKILQATGIDPDIRVKDLNEAQVSAIREYIEKKLRVEGDLKREIALNIKRYIEIGSYRGIRHRKVCRYGSIHQDQRENAQRSEAHGQPQEVQVGGHKWQ